MRFRGITIVLLAALAYAKDVKPYQYGTLMQMDSVKCGVDENSGKSLASELIGTDSDHKKTHELLCHEYVLQTDYVVYRIRPRDEKHPVLLPVGQTAEFRMEKDKMVLRVVETSGKDNDYTVVSMTPRAASPQTTASKN
jgi:hypothetical protein